MGIFNILWIITSTIQVIFLLAVFLILSFVYKASLKSTWPIVVGLFLSMLAHVFSAMIYFSQLWFHSFNAGLSYIQLPIYWIGWFFIFGGILYLVHQFQKMNSDKNKTGEP